MTRKSTLKVPMNDLIRVTVSGAGHEARKATMWCGHALKVPEFQTQHSIVVDAKRRRSHLWDFPPVR